MGTKRGTIFATVVLAGILQALPPDSYQLEKDWLVERDGFDAEIERSTDRLILQNGLVRRVFQLKQGMATVRYDNLATGGAMIRAVRPEALVTLNGREWKIGGLLGQPNLAYLSDEWLAGMEADPSAMRLVSVETGKPSAPFQWKRNRHHEKTAEWPPKGVKVSFYFEAPPGAMNEDAEVKRELLLDERFAILDKGWRIHSSDSHERIGFSNEGKAGEIFAPANVHCYAEREVPAGAQVIEVSINPGTDRGTSWGPGLGLVLGDRIVEVSLRPGDRGEHGHFELRDDGKERLQSIAELAGVDGGLALEHSYSLRVSFGDGRLRWQVAVDKAERWYDLFEIVEGRRPTAMRVGKTDRLGGDGDDELLAGEWGRCKIGQVVVFGAPIVDPGDTKAEVRVGVHYELYDGIPLMTKRVTVENVGAKPLMVDRLTVETLALVEHSNHVESREGTLLPLPRQLHVETDMAFGSFDHHQANRHIIHYRPDSAYTSQVNYRLEQPCLLEVSPERGPAQVVEPGSVFESFRVFEMAMDSTERERRGLAQRKLYRTVAPWVTENPLMHHLVNSDPARVMKAIDDAAEVGFEMVILSFGSGFNAENQDHSYLEQWRKVADYARQKGVDLGCYSLYSSRRIGGGNDIVCPDGESPVHGSCPAITSEWGQAYLKKLYALFEETGFTIFENDGPYPGDVDVVSRPPLQSGSEDSQWVHWRLWTDYYKWLRGRGVYINAPDYYYLSGSNKCGMGYREVNWSLPRDQQVIHTRQNIHDGTWEKTPSMGWMFVPLSQYHGGGAAATIEPLSDHIDHYRRMIQSNLGFGVQACYRGPRLFDSPAVRDMLNEQVSWFKQHREVLESDLIHLRRADGRQLDGMVHVNPDGEEAAMLVVFNPTEKGIQETWTVPLYYAGLSGEVTAFISGTAPLKLMCDRFSRVQIPLDVPAGEMLSISFR